MEAEDYVDPTGRVKLLQEDSSPAIKVESGFLNSFFQFMSTDPVIQKPRTPEEDEAANEASKCVKECYIEGLITDSKFLHTESLQQLVKHIILGKGAFKNCVSGHNKVCTFEQKLQSDFLKVS